MRLCNWSYFFEIAVFPKSVAMPSKIPSVTIFYAKALEHFPEKYFHGYREFDFHRSNYIVPKF